MSNEAKKYYIPLPKTEQASTGYIEFYHAYQLTEVSEEVYREANRRAAELADEISAMLTGTEPPANEAHEEAKPLTLEEVRAVLADKSKDGFTAQIRELLKKYGADRLSAIDPANYRALLTDAEGLKDAT